ncbi:MAG: SurA N-terminal domain-containing protein [Bacteroidales bacterium]|nr:SurA N-terminal domain-containing protein [Bacteroidales bacterium]MBQ9712293.1 SurA N-terminal domain-containing protein [Bacteroidales bacterium]
MAVLEKIRVKFGLAASIIIALGLLSFIVSPSDIASAFQSMSSKYDVGEIGNKSISYTDFQEDVQRMTSVNEIISGTSASSAAQQEQIRNAAWQNLVYKHLFIPEANAAGITVGEDELVDLSTGNYISPLISQNPLFVDENGSFSKDAVLTFVRNINADETGQLKLYWDYLQENVLNEQYYEKYASLFTQSNITNPLMLRRKIAENNNTTDVDFVMVPYSYTTDSSIVVSDNEIKEYYNSHKNLFRQQASRDMEYVVYEVVPSATDIESTKNSVAEMYEEFAQSDNVRNFLLRNSDRAYSEYWYKQGELSTISSDIDNFVWSSNDAGVSDIITSGNTFYVARVMDSQMIPDSAYVKHILLQSADADHVADSLLNVINNGENFANLAALYSDDQGSTVDGEMGNIGWMTQNYMIPGFEGVFTAALNKPYILKTQYGTHIVEVTKKTAPVAKKQVAILEKEALASKETFNDYYNRANTFATAAAGSYQNYRKAVDTLGVYSHPVSNLLESSNQLGAIDNTKEVTRWIFDNKAGKVSPIITVDNNYFFIATVKDIHKEGYATVNEAASVIREQLYFDKMSEKKAAEIKEKISGMNDLEQIAETLGSTVSSQSGIAFSSLTSQSLDPKFIGALSTAPEGQVCGPVAGSVGVYVFKVTGRDTGAFFTEEDSKNRDLQEAQYLTQYLLPVMMQDNDVKDNRARFY